MPIKLIMTDVDGTLINSDRKIPDKNIDAIRYAQSKGVYIAIASGRSFLSLKQYSDILGISDNYLVSFNGCYIQHDGEIVQSYQLKREAIIDIYEQLLEFDVSRLIYATPFVGLVDRESYELDFYRELSLIDYKRITDLRTETVLGETAPKLIVMSLDEELLAEAKAKTDTYLSRANNGIKSMFSAKTLLEYTSGQATKGTALEFVAGKLGIDIKDTMAFGDNFNDVEMLETAGIGVCIGSGETGVKQYADYVTSASNDDGALAEAIYKFI